MNKLVMNDIGLPIILVLTFMVGVLVGSSLSTSSNRKQAIEAGVGAWTINPSNGKTQFIYSKP